MKKILYFLALGFPMLSSCAWNEPTRVEKDFGNSVRSMIAEQLYDPQTARQPQRTAPETLSGAAALSAIEGYNAAARGAREQRVRQTGSPLPVVGTVSGTEEN